MLQRAAAAGAKVGTKRLYTRWQRAGHHRAVSKAYDLARQGKGEIDLAILGNPVTAVAEASNDGSGQALPSIGVSVSGTGAAPPPLATPTNAGRRMRPAMVKPGCMTSMTLLSGAPGIGASNMA